MGAMSIVDIVIIPEGDVINAFGAELFFPPHWSLESVTSSYVAKPYWIVSPQLLSPGHVTFAGIFPNGLSLDQASSSIELISLNIDANEDVIGLQELELVDAQFYLNDPLAPDADRAYFHMEVTSESSEVPQKPDTSPPYLRQYSFEIDPLTQKEHLYVDAYDNTPTPLKMEVKFKKNEWIPLDELGGYDSESRPNFLRITDSSGNQTVEDLNPFPILELWGGLATLLFISQIAYFYIKRRQRKH